MRVVLEEVESSKARLISDEKDRKEYRVDISQLPSEVSVGEVLEVTFDASMAKLTSVQRLTNETQNRLEQNRKKREQLLRRKKRK